MLPMYPMETRCPMQSSFCRLSDDESQTSHRLRHTSVREDQRVASQNRTAAEDPSDHSLESESFRDNPLFQFMLLSVAAVGLYGVMLVLRRFAPSSIPHDSLIDVSAIALLIFSVFLVLVVRTLGRQIAKRKEAEHALRKTIAALDEAAEEAKEGLPGFDLEFPGSAVQVEGDFHGLNCPGVNSNL